MLRKLYKFAASLKLAVILLLVLAVMLAVATYLESIYDAKTANHMVYGHPFFGVFLGVLWINIFSSAAIRFPWKRHQLGFVVTHLGLLILLAGSLQTMLTGIEGQMMLSEGDTSSRITMDEPVFFVGADQKSMQDTSAEFRWNPPRTGHPVTVALPGGLKARVDQYLHHAKEVTDYVADGQSAVAALKVRIYNGRVDVSEWLTMSTGSLTMGPATLYLSRLRDAAQVKEFLTGKMDPHDRGELQLLLGDQPHRVNVRDLAVDRELPVGDYRLKLVRYLPYAVVSEDRSELVNRSDEPVNPTVELDVLDGQGNSQRWLLFARLPNLNTRTASKGKELAVRLLYNFEPLAEKSLSLAMDSQGKVYYRLSSGKTGEALKGQPVPTGWMDLQFELQDAFAGARKVTECRPVKLTKKQENDGGAPPAILVTVEGAPKPGPYWMMQGDVVQVGDDAHPLVFGYGLRSEEVGVPVKLKKFEIGYDPGTRSAATYKSIVEVDGKDQTIQMNEPMYRNGFTFFQASFGEAGDGPAFSVLSVAKDPGIFLKYLGSICLVLGIAIMFYMKPYLTKKRTDA